MFVHANDTKYSLQYSHFWSFVCKIMRLTLNLFLYIFLVLVWAIS